MVREQSVESFYARLRESASASASSTPLLIFPSTSDVDSLYALKIVGHVLESDSVRYACYLVSSFKEIHRFVGPNLCSSSDEPVIILLVNWGCHRDLRKVLNLGPSSRVFVVDSHRPIHLHNLSDQDDRVVVLYTRDDEDQADLAYDLKVPVSALANASDLNSDDEGEDDSDGDEDENESESEEEDGGESQKRRRASDESEKDPNKLFRKLKKEYYSNGTFHGKPSGCLMYDLCHSLRKNTNELLWLACVVLTDQFVHERLTNEQYQAGVMELEQHVNSAGNLDVVTTVTLKDGTKVLVPDSSRIAYEGEPKLMLLQEWNLFDSMLCSTYIATKLKTWSDNGMKKLMLLLARMGFRLEDCKQKFQYMNVEIKRKMKEEFEEFLPEYGLNDFYYRESDGSCASKQFGVAYDALSLSKFEKLETGMQHAIKIQRAILRQGTEETGADFFHKLFESSWIVLDALAINSFMIRLTEKLCLEIEALAGEILMAICGPLSFLAAGILMLEVIEGSSCIDVSAGIDGSLLGAGLIFQLGDLIDAKNFHGILILHISLQRPQVPKFGNWENESDVPYTLYFDKARKGKKCDKMINPNDPAVNPDLFPNMARQAQAEAPPSRTRTKPDEPIGRGTARPVHERRVSREDGDFKQFTESPVRNDNMGMRAAGESAHRRQGGRGTSSGRPVRYCRVGARH
ncbi:hypothetical protein TEA_017161 [Camellia sinensis var. sinensis]|uniref:RIN4 pathogenic type III effector avirulence factor Avr cleavage site domain-containing protein n=1 Tax=Camellia sinensis var. sinensis TaxID=542762 RepID=A0A4V3WPY3_CAMSN|nr:hypothetical protein TEA_017161 [Camellia sinensis var. sinensis]